MKWKLLRLFLPLLIIGFIVPMIMPGPDGKPLMSWADWLPDKAGLDRFSSLLKAGVEAVDPEDKILPAIDFIEPQKVYKWKDQQGQWYFADEPNAMAVDAEEIELPRIHNTIRPLTARAAESAGLSSLTEDFNLSPTTVTLPGISGMIEDAGNTKQLSDERARQLDQL